MRRRMGGRVNTPTRILGGNREASSSRASIGSMAGRMAGERGRGGKVRIKVKVKERGGNISRLRRSITAGIIGGRQVTFEGGKMHYIKRYGFHSEMCIFVYERLGLRASLAGGLLEDETEMRMISGFLFFFSAVLERVWGMHSVGGVGGFDSLDSLHILCVWMVKLV